VSQLRHARSYLFVPGDDERKLERAPLSGADAVIVDLEDAVVPARKEHARGLLERSTAWQRPPLRLVRVNAGDVGDLDATAGLDLDAIVVPKSTAASVGSMPRTGHPVVALVETAEGVLDAYAIAENPRVEALMLGALDLGAELGLRSREDGHELLHARSTFVLASAAAGICSPIDSVHPSLDDDAALLGEAGTARDLGFGAKACVHPRQLAPIHEAFAPTAAELEWARTVVSAFENAAAAGQGAIAVGRELVDRPVYLRAQQLLEAATRRTT
jgi:citrate lyase beta subunit